MAPRALKGATPNAAGAGITSNMEALFLEHRRPGKNQAERVASPVRQRRPKSANDLTFMKIILQDRRSHLFYQGSARWGDSPAAAYDFGSSPAALDFCLENNVRDVEIVLKFPEPKYDMRLHPFAPHVQERARKSRHRGK